MEKEIKQICTELNDGQIAVTQATEKLLNLFSVSERYILVEWLNEIPLVDGSLYFDSKEELLEHFKSLPKIEGLTHTICRIRNAR